MDAKIVDRSEITIERIKKLCADHGYSISGLEKKLGYGNTSLSKAKNISVARVAEIADFFDVSVDYIVGRSDDPYRHRRPKKTIVISDITEAICASMEREHPEWFDDNEEIGENEEISSILSSHKPEEIERAIDFLSQYEKASPEIQAAIQTLLKASQQQP